MQIARNVGIIALIALVITVTPGGDNATDTLLTAFTMAFLVAIGFFVYRMLIENQFSVMALNDGWRAILYGSLGLIALMIAGASELFDTGAGTLAWIGFMVLAVFGLVRVFREATSY